MEKSWFVYIATNHTNTVLYTGITNDPIRRLSEHKTRKSESFTDRYHLYKIIWLQEFATPDEAISAEKKIKGWTRAKKMKLIQALNPNYSNLVTLR